MGLCPKNRRLNSDSPGPGSGQGYEREKMRLFKHVEVWVPENKKHETLDPKPSGYIESDNLFQTGSGDYAYENEDGNRFSIEDAIICGYLRHASL